MSGSARCQLCGRPVDDHDRDLRFTWPDPVLDAYGAEPAQHLWMSHDDPLEAVMLQGDDVGGFVRVLLPVQLTGGYRVTLGVWLGVHPDDLRRAHQVWWSPDYSHLALDGRLGNAIPPWGLLGEPVRAEVRDPDHTPYCVSSPNQGLADVLMRRWPHEEVLRALDP